MFGAAIMNGSQFNPRRSGEFGVQAKYFDGKRDLIDNALTGWLPLVPKFKVIRSVVCSVAVGVVDAFSRKKSAANFLTHDQPVFEILFSAAKIDANVARGVQVSVWGNGTDSSPFVAAFDGAKSGRVVVPEFLSIRHSKAAPRSRFSAVFTDERGRLRDAAASAALPGAKSLLWVVRRNIERYTALFARLSFRHGVPACRFTNSIMGQSSNYLKPITLGV